MGQRIRLLVVAPSPVVRRGLADLAADATRLEVTAAVGSVRAALAYLRGRPVDVAVIDDRVRSASGVDVVRLLKRSFPRLGIVLVRDRGASGAAEVPAVDLDADADALAEAVSRAVAGDAPAGPPLPAATARGPVGDPLLDGLKPIERRVLELLADGLSNREIADLVDLSERMVKKYVTAVFTALGVTRRTEAAVVYTTRRAIAAGASDPSRASAPTSSSGSLPPVVAELAADVEEQRAVIEELQQQLRVAEAELERLREEHDRYAVLYEELPVPHLLTDEYGVVLSADRAMADLLGLAPRELRGKTLASFVPEDGRRAFRQRLAAVARGQPVSDLAEHGLVLEGSADVAGRPVRLAPTPGERRGRPRLHWTVASPAGEPESPQQVGDSAEGRGGGAGEGSVGST